VQDKAIETLFARPGDDALDQKRGARRAIPVRNRKFLLTQILRITKTGFEMKARPPVARRRGCWNLLGARLAVFPNVFLAAAAAITAIATRPAAPAFSRPLFQQCQSDQLDRTNAKTRPRA
jgi:hypothetical protein